MTRDKRLARPVYEALPWFYLLAGIAALVGSYFSASGWLSFLLGVPGLLATVAGVVVLLRRRDFRRMRADYLDSGASILSRKD